MRALPSHMRRPRPRSRRPLVRWLRGVWTLPTDLLGHAAGALVSGRFPRRVGGAAAVGWLYPIRRGRGLDWVGAVTLGHAILCRQDWHDAWLDAHHDGDPSSRLVLAHELAHTRQHDVLGPLYLPLHILAQAVSALLSLVGRPHISRVHDHNPLEQTFICLSAGATRRSLPADELADYLAAFGL